MSYFQNEHLTNYRVFFNHIIFLEKFSVILLLPLTLTARRKTRSLLLYLLFYLFVDVSILMTSIIFMLYLLCQSFIIVSIFAWCLLFISSSPRIIFSCVHNCILPIDFPSPFVIYFTSIMKYSIIVFIFSLCFSTSLWLSLLFAPSSHLI